LMGDPTKLLEPVEITKREERLMRKMTNNCIKRMLTELFAKIGKTKLTDAHHVVEHAVETDRRLQMRTSVFDPPQEVLMPIFFDSRRCMKEALFFLMDECL
jgi:hypothetical protein